MDDLAYGTRNKRGDWQPKDPNDIAPIYRLPWKARDIAGFVKGYFIPWNITWVVLAAFYWFVLIPPIETLATLQPGWVIAAFLRNCVAVLAVYGYMEWRLYRKRAQGTAFKYNGKFPSDNPSEVFFFNSQVKEGILRTFVTGIPIWTAFEVGILWCYANGIGPWATLEDHPWALVTVFLLIPVWHETHFFVIHRIIHIPFFYKWIHSVHHNSVNPSPWSSLSMHPIEQLLFFSAALIHLVVPSHPLLALYSLNFSGLGAIVGHVGFDKVVSAKGETGVDTHAYTHYLHHKFFEVNYGDGLIPFDKIFGTWHDGTASSDEKLNARLKHRRERMAAKG